MISVDWTLFLQVGQFVVLLLILNAILYRPMRGMMEQRRKKIEGGHKTARDLDSKIQEKMSRYQEKLDEAKHQAGSERMQMKAEASRQEHEIVEEARDVASSHVADIKEKVAKDAEIARRKLAEETKNVAAMIAGKVLGRSL